MKCCALFVVSTVLVAAVFAAPSRTVKSDKDLVLEEVEIGRAPDRITVDDGVPLQTLIANKAKPEYVRIPGSHVDHEVIPLQTLVANKAKPEIVRIPDAVVTPAPERKCVPGKDYFNGCNRCYCTPLETTVCSGSRCGPMKESDKISPPEDYWKPSA